MHQAYYRHIDDEHRQMFCHGCPDWEGPIIGTDDLEAEAAMAMHVGREEAAGTLPEEDTK